MTTPADYFATLTVDDYASLAFGIGDDGRPDPTFEGGVAAGQGSAWRRSGDGAAQARLVPVRAGKIFVRWCPRLAGSGVWRGRPPDNAAGLPNWAPAAAGPWWVSDNLADMIVGQTRARFGEGGDTGLVAREFSAVKYQWPNDMGAVVVCETIAPIRVLVGVGRPVVTQNPSTLVVETFDDRQLQYVVLTQWPRGQFRAHEFFRLRHICLAVEFGAWWTQTDILGARGRLRRGMAQARSPRPAGAGGYPTGVVRPPKLG